MTNNVTLRQIGEALEAASTILILPHTSPDGDSIGSSIALCKALRGEGKVCHVIVEDQIPAYIGFLPKEYCTMDQKVLDGPADLVICVDCSEENRIPKRLELFRQAKVRACIDHHINPQGFGDLYYIDDRAAATAELIYTLIKEMGWDMDEEASTALYTAIVSDTGGFQYSNTRPETHIIAARLMTQGVDVNAVSVELFQNVPLSQAKAESRILEKVELVADGRGAVSCITNKELKELCAKSDDTESAIDKLRNIKGVEIAAFLKEKGDGIKVSLRAKTTGNVQQIAAKFNGGGHKKAAGCTIYSTMEEAVDAIKKEVAEVLEQEA